MRTWFSRKSTAEEAQSWFWTAAILKQNDERKPKKKEKNGQ